MEMSSRFLACLICGCGLALGAAGGAAQTAPGEEELIIKFRAGVSVDEIRGSVRRGDLQLRRYLKTAAMAERRQLGLTLARTGLDRETALRRLKADPAIEYVEPNVKYRIDAVANDSYFTAGFQWSMYGDLGSPANSYGSQAAEAWGQGHTGSSNIFVAVIDEGVQVQHPDLAPNMWVNPFDPVDGVDNDGNGYVDDRHGWNFHSDTNAVFKAGGDAHGTHVAGTIGARGGDGSGVAGVNWNVRMIAAKFIANGEGSTLNAVEAIDYMIDLKERHGLNIVAINASWGGPGYSRSLHEAVLRAAKAGILFVAAAGNDGENNDSVSNYPANLNSTVGTASESAANYNAVISVAAIDKTGALASFSNYGNTRVHIGAPGAEVLSAYPDGWAYMWGTSMAAPHVAGAAALYASTHPGASASVIRQALLASAAPTASLQGKVSTGGRLDLSSVIRPANSANYLGSDTTSLGSWKGKYGSQAYAIVGNATNTPSGYGMAQSGASFWIWNPNTSSKEGLEKAGGNGRLLACWYAPNFFEVNVTVPDSTARDLALYCVDAGNAGRAEKVEVFDAATGTLLDTRQISSFSQGIYLRWRIQGSVRVRFTKTGEWNSVVSGVFLDPVRITSAQFAGSDHETMGRWTGRYGTEAFVLARDGSHVTELVDVQVTSSSSWEWIASTSDPRGLDRVAGGWFLACWYSPTFFDVKVALRDGKKHRVSIYCVDASASNRSQRIEAFNTDTGELLTSLDLSNFLSARYLTWEVSGQVTFRLTCTGPWNAVAGGVFVDPAP